MAGLGSGGGGGSDGDSELMEELRREEETVAQRMREEAEVLAAAARGDEARSGTFVDEARWRVPRRTEWDRVLAEAAPLRRRVRSWAGETTPASGERGPLRVSAEVEIEVRRRFAPEVEAAISDFGFELGAVVGVRLLKWDMSFVDALRCAQETCREAFVREKQAESLVLDLSVRTWFIFKFLAGFLRFRFQTSARPLFQKIITLLTCPEGGVAALVDQWLKADADNELANTVPTIQFKMKRLVDDLVVCLKDLQKLLATRDKAIKAKTAEHLHQLADLLATPLAPSNGSPANWTATVVFPLHYQVHIFQMSLENSDSELFVEARVALTDPIFKSEEMNIREGIARSVRGCVAYALSKPQPPLRQFLFSDVQGRLREAAGQDGFWVCSQAVTRKLCRSIVEPLGFPKPPRGLLGARRLFSPGEKVVAFFSTNDHPWGYRYAHVDAKPQSLPVLGMTAGWLPGTIVGPTEPNAAIAEGFGHALVRFEGKFCDPFGPASWSKRFFTASGQASVPHAFKGYGRYVFDAFTEELELQVPLALVRPADDKPPPPLLSILCLRWYDYWSYSWWSDYNVTSDGMLVDLFEGPCSMRELLPGEYEVHTVFVKESANLDSLDLKKLRAELRGKDVAAWYFLWPMLCSDGSGQAGAVEERSFFAFCRRAERLGIRTAWPHESQLYRLLCGKLWLSQMSLNRTFRVPPTTRVQCADLRQGGLKTAERAIRALIQLRATVWDELGGDVDTFRGVAKLGFSWCGQDVRPFTGPEGLLQSLDDLFGQSGSQQTSCLVQLRVEGVIGEHRIICLRDAHGHGFRKESVWMFNAHMVPRQDNALGGKKEQDFSVATSAVVPAGEVAARLFGGDADALRDAESQASELADRWLAWFRTEAPEPPQCTRLDFLVAHAGRGSASVWTCEVGECGASLCSLEVHGRNIAALNNAAPRGGAGDDRLPVPQPDRLPRNSGWKS